MVKKVRKDVHSLTKLTLGMGVGAGIGAAAVAASPSAAPVMAGFSTAAGFVGPVSTVVMGGHALRKVGELQKYAKYKPKRSKRQRYGMR